MVAHGGWCNTVGTGIDIDGPFESPPPEGTYRTFIHLDSALLPTCSSSTCIPLNSVIILHILRHRLLFLITTTTTIPVIQEDNDNLPDRSPLFCVSCSTRSASPFSFTLPTLNVDDGDGHPYHCGPLPRLPIRCPLPVPTF